MTKKGKNGKVDKKTLNKIEFVLIGMILLVSIYFLINGRTLSTKKANILASEIYGKTEQVLSNVLTGTEWLVLSEECIEREGYMFCKSKTEGLDQYSDLEDYINSVCTEEFTAKILSEKQLIYKNINEELYILDLSRQVDVFYAGLKEVKVVSISSHEIKCNIICNYYIDLDTKELYTMSYDYIIKKSWGNWKTSYFELPY